jgi:hypothetical protein
MLMCVCWRILASSRIPQYDLGRQTPHFCGGSITILIFGTSLDVINEIKTFLCQSFNMKDLGDADVILNIMLIK